MTPPSSPKTQPERPSSQRTTTRHSSEANGRPFPLRAFFGHHKCATGWIGGTIREIALHMGRQFRIINRPIDFETAHSLGDFIDTHGVEILSYANANIEHARSLSLYRGFHVVRDPRDVLVSAYFSHKNTHDTAGWPELRAHRKELQSMSKADGLMAEMDFSAPFFEDMYTWDYTQDNVLEVKMEDLTADPMTYFIRIADYLNLLAPQDSPRLIELARRMTAKSNRLNHRGRRFMPGELPLFPVPRRSMRSIPRKLLIEIVDARSFEKLTGRNPGEENRQTHLRKGVPGDWQNHFTPRHTGAFKDRYNDLVLKLGYEDSPDW